MRVRRCPIVPVSEVNYQRMGLNHPVMRVSLSASERRESLAIGALVGGGEDKHEGGALRFALLESEQAKGTVITVKAADYAWLSDAVDALRERKFIEIDPTQVTQVDIRQGERSVQLQKLERENSAGEDDWQVLSVSGHEANTRLPGDPQVIEHLLEALRNIDAEEFVSDAPSAEDNARYGFDQPNAVVKIKGAGKTTTLVFGKVLVDAPQFIYAKLAGEPYIYAVRSRVLALVSTNPLQYRERVVVKQPSSAQVFHIKLSDLETSNVLIDEKIDPDKTTWPVALEKFPKKQREALLSIISASKEFRVKHYVTPSYGPIEGLPWRYHMEVKSVLPGGGGSQEKAWDYFFSFRIKADRQVAGSPQADLNFTLPQDFIDDLFSVSFELQPPELPATPPAIEAVNVELLKSSPPASGPLPGAFLPSDVPIETSQVSP